MSKRKYIDFFCLKDIYLNFGAKKGIILVDFMFKRHLFKCWCKKGNVLVDFMFKRNLFKLGAKKEIHLVIFCLLVQKGNTLIDFFCLEGMYVNVGVKKEIH